MHLGEEVVIECEPAQLVAGEAPRRPRMPLSDQPLRHTLSRGIAFGRPHMCDRFTHIDQLAEHRGEQFPCVGEARTEKDQATAKSA